MRMEELVALLNSASEAYYNGGSEILSDHEYDQMFEELQKMEQETGISLPDSPTNKVGAVVTDKLPKVQHKYPALSLDKVKDPHEYQRIFQEGEKGAKSKGCVIMPKCDGSTLCAFYTNKGFANGNAHLVEVATRGNGSVGSSVIHNAPYIDGLPMEIPFQGELNIRGEALMSYEEFDRINATLPDDEKFSHPRNLANATVQMRDSSEMRKRKIEFQAFKLVHIESDVRNYDNFLFEDQLDLLDLLGIQTVQYEVVETEQIVDKISEWEARVKSFEFPTDGLVTALNDVEYAETLPGTNRTPSPMVGFAFKWKDEEVETILRKIEWNTGRTGIISPVAILAPVEIEGATISRATLHNVSNIMHYGLEPGCTVKVIRANKVIPSIVGNASVPDHIWNYKKKLSNEDMSKHTLPRICPSCGQKVVYQYSQTSKEKEPTIVCRCDNEDCPSKCAKGFIHFAERDCMNMEGISESIIMKMVDKGFLKEYRDFYHLSDYQSEILGMEGFGEVSYQNMLDAIERSRKVPFINFIHSLGIPGIGFGQAKLIEKFLKNSEYGKMVGQESDLIPGKKLTLMDAFLEAVYDKTDFSCIKGFGSKIMTNLQAWIDANIMPGYLDGDETAFDRLLAEVSIIIDVPAPQIKPSSLGNKGIAGNTYVITGKLNNYTRFEIERLISNNGGFTSNRVTAAVTALITNFPDSTTVKCRTAKQLGIPIISETEFINRLHSGI